MLTLKNITKTYVSGDEKVEALRGVDLEFRDSEFVSILGQSGCGKTTMLNIIGGLDRYTDGDLLINGVSTKTYNDSDWDTYRNHSVGFVFQNYNLIPHQTVLENVELALTLTGVGKRERRERAIKALTDVGLKDQIRKKPNQLSGGQMQRVAIARALVNDPKILLADEPTGALDSQTSVQIMEILKEISHDKLIIMVTHNPSLAEEYSSRIIKLLDGKVIDDTAPYQEPAPETDVKKVKEKRPSMSFFTALSLSLKNLMTKKARTFLTSFAGSIGIIGIALVLSISNGISQYINDVQEQTLSSYPLTIEEATVSMDEVMTSMLEQNENRPEHELDKIYSNDVMGSVFTAMSGDVKVNNLKEFKKYLEDNEEKIEPLVTDIQYSYQTIMNIYKGDTENGAFQVNPNTLFQDMMGTQMSGTSPMASMYAQSMSVWRVLIDNPEFLEKQYDIVEGELPKSFDEVVLIVDKNNEITDMALYSLGLKDPAELQKMMQDIAEGKEVSSSPVEFSFDEITSLKFKLLLNTDYFEKNGDIWVDKSKDAEHIKRKLDDAIELKVVGIVRPSEDSTATAEAGAIGYTRELATQLINRINESEIVKEQKDNPEVDVFSGIKFTDMLANMPTAPNGMSSQFGASLAGATYKGNLLRLGVADVDNPSAINVFAKDFASKDAFKDLIKEYNETVSEENEIQYTDYVGMLMSSITTIIDVISYILIAFVAISLVVSSIMIGIITYISVLERTKEIGILRSIGASKRDISRVFNAETLIVGFTAGLIGIGMTLLLIIPINAIIASLADISATAILPANAAVVLVAISMFLTFIAGLIPAKIASKKDPVVALRSE